MFEMIKLSVTTKEKIAYPFREDDLKGFYLGILLPIFLFMMFLANGIGTILSNLNTNEIVYNIVLGAAVIGGLILSGFISAKIVNKIEANRKVKFEYSCREISAGFKAQGWDIPWYDVEHLIQNGYTSYQANEALNEYVWYYSGFKNECVITLVEKKSDRISQ